MAALTSCLLSIAQLLHESAAAHGKRHMTQVTSLNTHILLLLPVPKSIMICLFLHKSQITHFPQESLSIPVEEHDRTWVIQLIHLPTPRHAPEVSLSPFIQTAQRTLLKSGTCVISTR